MEHDRLVVFFYLQLFNFLNFMAYQTFDHFGTVYGCYILDSHKNGALILYSDFLMKLWNAFYSGK